MGNSACLSGTLYLEETDTETKIIMTWSSDTYKALQKHRGGVSNQAWAGKTLKESFLHLSIKDIQINEAVSNRSYKDRGYANDEERGILEEKTMN